MSLANPRLAAVLASERLLYLLLALALFTGFFYQLGAVPLFDLDEGAFSQATREMFLRDDFLSTYLNGQPRYDKPILIYWLQAASVALLGPSEGAFRLPSALAASVWTLLLLGFTRRVVNSRQGLYAAILLASALAVTVIGKAATADALLNMLLAGSVLALYLYLREGQRVWLYAAALAMGLGFLTKGPVAVVIPAGVSLLYCASRGEWRIWLGLLAEGRAWALFLIIAAPWYLLQFLREGDGFLQGFFLRHNLDRLQQPLDGHGGGWWYYMPVLLVAVLPYTTLLLRTLARAREQWRAPLGRYLLLWFGLVFVLFSLAATKLPHYLLYGCSGLFILMAAELDEPASGPMDGLLLLPQALLLLLLLILPGVLVLVLPRVKDALVQAQLTGLQFTPAYYLLLLALLALTGYFMRERHMPIALKLLLSGVLLSAVLSAQVLPTVAAVRQQPVKAAGLLAGAEPGAPPLVMWRLNLPSFSVYSGRVVERREPRPGDLVLTRQTALAALGPHAVRYAAHGIALVRMEEPDTSSHDALTPSTSSGQRPNPAPAGRGELMPPNPESQP